ncbi:MAG: hypothetical protein DMD34_11330 [Gemmatimonadetes bacterium]|nr:MAG: hypothetical protein DMD34_11330 [Gemmatimonadota bacterium]
MPAQRPTRPWSSLPRKAPPPRATARPARRRPPPLPPPPPPPPRLRPRPRRPPRARGATPGGRATWCCSHAPRFVGASGPAPASRT